MTASSAASRSGPVPPAPPAPFASSTFLTPLAELARQAAAAERSESMNWTAEFAATETYTEEEIAELDTYIEIPFFQDGEEERRAMEASLTLMTLGVQTMEEGTSAGEADRVLEMIREEEVAGDEEIEEDLPIFSIRRRGESVAGEPELQSYWDGKW
jgi:hypothetical protein